MHQAFEQIQCRIAVKPLTEQLSCDTNFVSLGELAVVDGACSSLRVDHTREAIVDDSLTFLSASATKWIASSRGRDIALDPGDGILHSNAETGMIALPAATRFLHLRLPVRALAPFIPDLGTALARPIPGQSPAMRLLKSYLGVLGDREALQAAELRRLAVTHICDLLALALGATRDAAAVARCRGVRAARLNAIKGDIERHLGDHALSIHAVAARHRITTDYVRKLFDGEGLSYSAYVLNERLRRAHLMLGNPRFRERTIASIALDCGFGDLSYFNRAFRRRFGATPSDSRAAAPAGFG